MIFERLAEVILKRSKIIIIIWIIALLCAVPLALKAGSVLDYDTSNMAGPHAESIEGADVMNEYFKGSSVPMESAVLLVASFNTPEGKLNALALGTAVENEKSSFLDSDGNEKISDVITYGVFTAAGDDNTGVVIFAVIYNQHMVDDSLVSGDTPQFRTFIGNVLSDSGLTGVTPYVSGTPAVSYDTQNTASKDISKIDIFSVLMILILVGLFFRSFVTSAMPPLTIGAAFGITMCLMFFVGSVLNIIYMTEMMLLVSMLGAGCDYCIFILARYREERVQGADHEHAVKAAVTWAGESITTSGLAVMIGFGAMSICSFSMISTMGIMLAIGIVIALTAALTLITSVLALFGEKIFWPTKMDSLKKGGKAERGWHGKVARLGHRYFTRSVNFSIKYAAVIVAVAVLFTVPAAYVMTTSHSSYDMVGAMSSGEGLAGTKEIQNFSNGGMMMPNYAIMQISDDFGPIGNVTEFNYGGQTQGQLYWTISDSDYQRLQSFSASLYSDDNAGEVWGVYMWSSLTDTAASGIPQGTMTDHDYTMAVYMQAATYLPDTLSKQMEATLGTIVSGYETMLPPGQGAVYNDPTLVATVDYALNYAMATSVGGVAAGSGTITDPTQIPITFIKFTLVTKDEAMADRSMDTIKFMDSTLSAFANDNKDMISQKWLTGSAVVMYEISEQVSSEFLKVEILAIALIFILLFFVMKSYLTPIRSLLTILMSVVWTVAITHLLFGGLLGVGVIWMIPVILIVVCLGLGMDYDILLTTRIKENHLHKGLSNDEAIRYAVTHSGSVITICGLIMGGAFGTLMLSGTTMLQEFGFALCFAILVDALIVRTYIVPAAMHLLGEWNWKGPKFLHKKTIRPPE
ncbi:MAG: MMPL family transporter [Methanomassiliicoccaceae archaeon]|nr:MMPL family transporter [Methanomassiliicoccaceae archaeon]